MAGRKLPVCIIGSGLSAISAANALLGNGAKNVLMIDPGLDMPHDVAQTVLSIHQKPAWRWSEQEIESLRAGVESSAKGVKEKLLYGSNFASRSLDCFPVTKDNAAFYMSFAKSGLGNIWGAGLLPMHVDDMHGWPISHADLQPHYQSVLRFMPMSGRHDRLEKLFPLAGISSCHGPSRQAASMFARLEKHADDLERLGFFFGASRLAGCFHGRSQKHHCQYCGMCLYGCPYGIIYSSRETLEKLKHNLNFNYRAGLVATGLNQSGGTIQVNVVDLKGNQLEPVKAQRVFLACGPFATARIILNTLKSYNKPLHIKTSDQYYLPFVTSTGQPDIDREKLHTMCQAFWILRKKEISPYLIHSSIYTYNDLYSLAMQKMAGKLYPPLLPLINRFLSHLYFTITYLHSDHSASLQATLQQDSLRTLVVKGTPNPQSRDIFRAVRRNWSSLSKYTGLYPAPFYKAEKLPGGGNHSGCCFPMSKTPTGMQTDTLGRLPNLDNVHIVDSSVLPSITATTITYTIMANAHRIASQIKE